MNKSILLIGVGGQGTILMSKILAEGLSRLGYDVKMTEIHGMSQRGGSVTTQIKFGDKVYAPSVAIGEADVIVAFEKIEALRALPYLKKDGILISDDREIYPSSVLTGKEAYPHNALKEISDSGARLHIVQAEKKAKELGNIKAQNICLLGALVKVLGLTSFNWSELIAQFVPQKAVELNIAAFNAGTGMF